MFEHALRRSRRLELETIPAGDARPDVLVSSLEQVRDNDLVISKPMIGTRTRPLVTNEPLHISLTDKDGRHIGTTRCMGRIKIPTGGGGMLYGYRLALPKSMDNAERRDYTRVAVEFDLAPQAELLLPRRGIVLRGTLLDISASGARLRCTVGSDLISEGDEALLKTELPNPVDELSEFISVKRVKCCNRTGHCTIGIAFNAPIVRVEQFVRQRSIQRAKRTPNTD